MPNFPELSSTCQLFKSNFFHPSKIWHIVIWYFFLWSQCTFGNANSTHCSNHVGIWVSRAPYQIRKFAGCACAGNVFPATYFNGNRELAILACITARASRTHGGGENVPGIPGACAIRNFTYLARGPLREYRWLSEILQQLHFSTTQLLPQYRVRGLARAIWHV